MIEKKINIVLTERQVSRLKEGMLPFVKGYGYHFPNTLVVKSERPLSDGQIKSIENKIALIPNDKTKDEKRMDELKGKPSLTHAELVELLRKKGVI